MTLTPDEAHAMLAEAVIRSRTMEQITILINMFSQFIMADVGSDLEDALHEEISKMVEELVKQGEQGLIGQMVLGLASIISYTSSEEDIQEYLNNQRREIDALLEKARDHHHPN